MSADISIDVRRRVTLSPTQRALLASQLRTPSEPVQNMALLARFDGAVDAARLAVAIDTVIAASDVLRTIVDGSDNGRAHVTSEPPVATELVTIDRDELERWASDRARHRLDLRSACYDSAVVRHDDDGSVWWFCNFHHLVIDARSYAVMFDAVSRVYHGEAAELPSYYAVADELSTDSPQRRRAVAHWSSRTAVPALDRLYSPAGQHAPAHRSAVQPTQPDAHKIAERLGGEYAALSDDLASTALLASTSALYVHALTGSERMTLGVPVHNRRTASARDTIGPLMELFPVDVDVESSDTPRTLHRRVLRALTSTIRHAAHGTSPDAHMNVVVNVIPGDVPTSFGAIPVAIEWLPTGAMPADQLLRVQLTGYGDGREPDPSGFGPGTRIHLDLDATAVPRGVRTAAAAHFGAALGFMVADPDRPISDLVLGTASDHERLSAWEVGPVTPGPAPLLADRLRERLAGTEDIVVVDRGEKFSGRDVWRWVESLASELRDERRVTVELRPSVQAVVAVYAAVVAGVPFVPIDPTHPEGRRDRLALRSQATRRIRQRADVDLARSEGFARAEPGEGHTAPRPDDEAYLIFTSGSTGEPKGVPITQQALADYIRFAVDSYFDQSGEAGATAALFGSLSFDLTITSLFAPILSGGSVVAFAATGPAALNEIADDRDIDWIKATPTHLELLVRILPEDHLLSTVVVGGEAFGSRLAAALLAHDPNMAVFNEYGPTEAVVGCMIHRLEEDDIRRSIEVPIGRPAPGVTLRVADRFGNRLPPGATGELLISHPGLTTGYLSTDRAESDSRQRAGETDGPFQTIDGVRFYRSGDLVRLDGEDRLVYKGRIDEQLKVGGIRLDPLEVEAAIDRHPAVERSVVRMWAPKVVAPEHHCLRCGLPDTVPGVRFDDDGVCDTCVAFDRVKDATTSWFRTPTDLIEIRDRGRARTTGPYDCLALVSGGKDSTYALYRLVDLGFRPYALTLDNGFLAEGAKDNVRAVTQALGVDHEFVTSSVMNEVFRDSLATFSNVCNGCYKTIYTLAVNRAVELDIPIIVTGLSRGQLFETRLIPEQFRLDRFDPDAIDRAVIQARKHYHRAPDVPNRLLDTDVFDDDDVFERIEFVDIYRYLDVELDTVLAELAGRTPWQRPADTGRSTNCLINVAGIHTHLVEQGYHNYAVPYAWDVRLGHKTRDEAIAELDDDIDQVEVDALLSEVGYAPTPRRLLTAWLEIKPGATVPSPTALRGFLAEMLPAFAVPAAFVDVAALPMTANGKLDERALPAPQRVHRSGVTAALLPGSDLERRVIDCWEAALGIEPIGVEDDFFAIGGDSLLALETIVQLGSGLGIRLAEELAFVHTTPRALAAAIEDVIVRADRLVEVPSNDPLTFAAHADVDPAALSSGQRSVLFEQRVRPDAAMFNLGRVFRVHGQVDAVRLFDAVRRVTALHPSLSLGYGPGRPRLEIDRALHCSVAADSVAVEQIEAALEDAHRAPFDVVDGPLMRCRVQPVDDGSTAVLIVAHHVTCDLESLATLWTQIDSAAHGHHVEAPPIDLATFDAWQQQHRAVDANQFWLSRLRAFSPTSFLGRVDGAGGGIDGFIRRASAVRASELSAVAGTTPTTLALAAAAAALGPYFESGRVPLNLVASTRTDPVADRLVGYLLNPLPFQLDAAPARQHADLISDAASDIGQALTFRSYPVAQMVADARAEGIALDPLNVLVSVDAESTSTFGEARVTQHAMFNGDAVADLSFFVEIRQEMVEVSLEHRAATVDSDLAAALLDRFSRSLELATHDPSTPVSALDDVTPRSVAIGADLVDDRLVIAQLLEHVRTRPDGPAVRCGDDVLTWRELGQHSDAVARALVRRGVAEGSRVLVNVTRSTELIAAIVGVQRAGCAYVPLDPAYPRERLDRIIAEAQASAAVVGSPMSVTGVSDVIEIDRSGIDGCPWQQAGGAERAGSDPLPTVSGDGDAYVIFTSGSTGVPSGVAVTHAQLAASTNARRQVYSRRVDEFVVLSSTAFDSSIVGVFWTLADGGCVTLPVETDAHDIDALVSLIARPGVSHTLCVPTLYGALLQRRPPTTVSWPSQVIVAGEACSAAVVAQHFRVVPDASLTNEYGPTEATVWSTVHRCRPNETSVPIGGPIPGSWVAVVDRHDDPVPVGVTGELVVGGTGVTAGYVNDPVKTDERFADGPSGEALPAGRRFRTGDRAQLRGGVLHFLGRLDDQLNVGGVRVHAGEIEHVLMRHPAVDAAVVGAVDRRSIDELVATTTADDLREALRTAAGHDDPGAALGAALRARNHGPTELVAHVRSVDRDIAGDLRQLIRDALPTTMAPASYQVHEQLPMTPNGKVDRIATLALGPERNVASPDRMTHVGADANGGVDTGLEGRMLRIFRAVLSDDEIGLDDSFFDSGGDSLQSLVLLHELERDLGITMSTSEIFEHPSARRLAEHLAADGNRSITAPDPTEQLPAPASRELRSLVIPIATSGDKPPIFAVHHLGTNAEYFRPLSQLLGDDQPMYGLAAPLPLEPFGAADYDLDIAYDVASIAHSYVREVQRLAPSGPVVITGTCQGALFAYEVAQQLRDRGRDVPLLVMLIDWHAPHIEYSDRGSVLALRRLRDLQQQGWPGLRRLLSVRGPRLRFQRRAEIHALRVARRFGVALPYRLRVREYIEQSLDHFNGYRYRPYSGRAIVVRGADDRRISDADQTAGWGDLIDELDIEFVPGWGVTILQEPNVPATAAVVGAALDRV